jgi:LysR family transcriptional regulator for bpeEF and oprC
MPVTLGRHVLVALLPGFLRQHPQLKLNVTLTDRLTDLVQERIDIAVRVGALADSNLIARRVGNLARTLCASPEFLNSHGVPRKPEDIRPEHCIPSLDDGKGRIRHWTFSQQGIQHKLVPAGRLAFDDESAAVTAAVHGGGFVQACSIGVEAHIAAGSLRPLLLDWREDEEEPVSLVYPRHRQSSAQIKAFTQFAIACFR